MRNPFKRAAPAESKSYDLLPEGFWQQLVAAQDMGLSIDLEQAVGLPAVLAVIRFMSHAAGLVPLDVIRDGSKRERAIETWQHRLLHDRPGPPPTTPFNFQADIASNFCGRGNAYIRKLKPTNYAPRMLRDTPRVTELKSIYADAITPKLADNGSLIFKDASGRTPVDRTTADIIQIRSFSVTKDGLMGVSPITAARTFVSAGLKRNQFEERHLTNGISPSLAVNFPRGMGEEQAGRWLDFISQRHGGSSKAGKAIGVPDGATITPLPISLADALFAEMTQLSMEQACAMYQVPLAIMCHSTRMQVTDDDYRFFVTWALGPLLTAMSQAFKADDDLFMPGVDDDLSVSPRTSALMEMDPMKKAQVQHTQVQDGTRLVDELRGEDGYGPLPPIPDNWQQEPGKVPQITPVGAAPNPEVNTSGPPVPQPGEEY